jgi:rhodanese-related sulfurtransferase
MTSPDLTNPTTVDTATLRESLAASGGPRILDVRTPGEFDTAHIPGAYNVPLDLLKEHRTELRAHQTLAQAGLPNVKILDGGMLAWQNAGAPVNRIRPRWDLERQVRLVAGLIVLTSVLGSLLVPGLQWVAALLGAGLTVAAITNTCAMGMLLAKLPYNRGTTSCDLDTIVGQLRDTAGRP